MSSFSINLVQHPRGNHVKSVCPSTLFLDALSNTDANQHKMLSLAYILSAFFPHLSVFSVSPSLIFVFYIFMASFAIWNFKDFR